jgi:hypothetical protein
VKKLIVVSAVAVLLLAGALLARARGKQPPVAAVPLTIYPARPAQAATRHNLICPVSERSTQDALAYYEAAFRLAKQHPKESDVAADWLGKSPAAFLHGNTQQTLEVFRETFHQADLAARCARCTWKEPTGPNVFDTPLPEVQLARNMARLVAFRTRVKTLTGRYPEAVASLQTGYGLARHLGERPWVITGLVASSIADMMNAELLLLCQQPDAPNLYNAIAAMPSPLIDLRKAVDAELAGRPAASEKEERKAFAAALLAPARLDRELAIVRCIEALRLYAGAHQGKLPATLDEITEVSVPVNPLLEKPFGYHLDGEAAVLDADGKQDGWGNAIAPKRYRVTLHIP